MGTGIVWGLDCVGTGIVWGLDCVGTGVPPVQAERQLGAWVCGNGFRDWKGPAKDPRISISVLFSEQIPRFSSHYPFLRYRHVCQP